jgi:Fe-S cluster biosynthesis and repair protein YggX
LKIGDFVLKPEEKFSKADNIMKNSTQNWKNLSGVLINEAQMFEAEQDKIRKIAKFDLEKVIDTK